MASNLGADKNTILQTVQRELENTLKVLKAFPSDKMGFKPNDQLKSAGEVAKTLIPGHGGPVDQVLQGVLGTVKGAVGSAVDAAAPGDTIRVAQRLSGAFDDAKVAHLLATALTKEGQASGRLAQVFDTIAPDEERKRRVLALTRSLLDESAVSFDLCKSPFFASNLAREICFRLFLADGLDRGHQQHVTGVNVDILPDTLLLRLSTGHPFSREVASALSVRRGIPAGRRRSRADEARPVSASASFRCADSPAPLERPARGARHPERTAPPGRAAVPSGFKGMHGDRAFRPPRHPCTPAC